MITPTSSASAEPPAKPIAKPSRSNAMRIRTNITISQSSPEYFPPLFPTESTTVTDILAKQRVLKHLPPEYKVYKKIATFSHLQSVTRMLSKIIVVVFFAIAVSSVTG
jgi:hypothetical protein